MSEKTAITPKRSENFPEWYQQVVYLSDLAEHAPVRGCMVIKPWGYSIWENAQRYLDAKFKETGHQNAYFPLFIPLSFLEKEAKHVEGFAKECAVVTHHRLEVGPEGRLVPAGKLEEPLVVRPTSETIIGEMFSKWIQSHRDLPLLLNQWANVVRWEMRTRLFLRTTEFLWQEGHTAHASSEEAHEEALRMFAIYKEFAQGVLAIPAVCGRKTERERFPGAVETYTFELMMQDGKALQGGTSHFLGQTFAKSAQIKFFDKDDVQKYAWTTSWGISTRIIGALVMAHGDDDGLVLPPRIAPAHVVILPVIHTEEAREDVLAFCRFLAKRLREVGYYGQNLVVHIDERSMRGGEKGWHWIKKGAPIRLPVGMREVEAKRVSVHRRDRPHKEGIALSVEELVAKAGSILDDIQSGLFEKAKAFQREHTRRIDTKEELYRYFAHEGVSGFALAHWCGLCAFEEQVQADLGVTIRCIPLEDEEGKGRCICCAKPSPQRVVFAKAY